MARTPLLRKEGNVLACNSFTPFEVFFPFANSQLLKEIHRWIEFSKGCIEMNVVSLLFSLDSEAILTQKGLNGNRVCNLEQRRHEPLGNAQRRERDLERIEVKEKKRAAGALIDGKHEAPVFDLAACVRPLVRIFVAQLDEVGIDAIPVDKQTGNAPAADLCVVTDKNTIAEHFISNEFGVDKRTILPMQMRMRKITDVVDDHRVVSLPREIDRRACPGPLSFKLGYIGNLPLIRVCRIAWKNPDQPVANFDRITVHPERRHRTAKQIVRNVDNPAIAVVRPAMISA